MSYFKDKGENRVFSGDKERADNIHTNLRRVLDNLTKSSLIYPTSGGGGNSGGGSGGGGGCGGSGGGSGSGGPAGGSDSGEDYGFFYRTYIRLMSIPTIVRVLYRELTKSNDSSTEISEDPVRDTTSEQGPDIGFHCGREDYVANSGGEDTPLTRILDIATASISSGGGPGAGGSGGGCGGSGGNSGGGAGSGAPGGQ